MHIVVVNIHVKSEFRDAFLEATLDNVENSLLEPGIARFDFLQQQDDPNRFLLVEVYRQPEDVIRHKETAHYARWRDNVAEMMAEPRVGTKYDNLSPNDSEW